MGSFKGTYVDDGGRWVGWRISRELDAYSMRERQDRA